MSKEENYFKHCRTTAFLLAVIATFSGVSAASRNNGMTLIGAKGASFQMGQAGIADTVHQVSFTYDFWMDTTEVTQADFRAFMGFNPSQYPNDSGPVEMVTWYDAALYCNERSKRDHLDTFYLYTGKTLNTQGDARNVTALQNLSFAAINKGYRLPTEAEWEFAARENITSTYWWRADVNGDYCWYQDNSNQTTHPVARKKPTAFGLYDMVGNVLEWTMNVTAKSNYPKANVTDPLPIVSGIPSARGGKFSAAVGELAPALRYRSIGSYLESGTYGFRVVQRAVAGTSVSPASGRYPATNGWSRRNNSAGRIYSVNGVTVSTEISKDRSPAPLVYIKNEMRNSYVKR